MPLPKTSNVGKIMHELKGSGRPRKQMIAIAMGQARKYGADIPEKPNKRTLAMKARASK